MIYLICAVLSALSIYLAVRLSLLHKSIGEVCEELTEILGTAAQNNSTQSKAKCSHTNVQGVHTNAQGVCTNAQGVCTNALVTISSRDRHIRRLAAQLNRQLSRLRSRQLKYENGDRELKEAITNISHDLRTPLTAMSGYLELLKKELEAGGASDDRPASPSSQKKSARYLAFIQNRLDTMKQLTEDLFRYSIVLSMQEEKPERLSLNRVLEDSLMGAWSSLEQRRITPVISIPQTPVTRLLDPSALSRIFANILSNAVKYSDGDLCVTLNESGAITFSNHAAALTPVAVEKLFDRFYTVENSSASTGLGLSIARLLTERMGGAINADYKEGKLHITVQFPCQP